MRRFLHMCVLPAVAVVTYCGVLFALKPPVSVNAAAKKTQPARRQYMGFQSCLRCHNSGVQGVAVTLPGGVTLNLADDQWVLYREFPIWSKRDKHGQAYTVLLNERSKQMGRLMGVTEIHRDKRCLTCHTGFPIHDMAVDEQGLVSADLQKNLDVNLGVSCEGCHGPAGDVRQGNKTLVAGWMGPHQIQPVAPYEKTNPWRFLAPETKAAKYGFADVRSPASKARICASCHIGNAEQGKVVTHEMYAAGHPPLPGFEIETFVAQMPKHWREFAEKSEKVRNNVLKHSKDDLYDEKTYKLDNLHRTKSVLVGALVAFSEYLNLTAQLADAKLAGPTRKPDWPELAQFECFACHHDLRDRGWRQARKSPAGTPGRPTLREWPTSLVQLALRAADVDDANLDQQMKAVRQTIQSQPFGNRDALKTSAASVAKWALSAAQELEKKVLSQADGLRIRKQIAAMASSTILDYDSARQLVWAFQIVNGELKSENKSNDAQIQKILASFESDMFLLNLRSGRTSSTQLSGEPKARNTVEVDLAKILPPVANYRPDQFQQQFKRISALLDQK